MTFRIVLVGCGAAKRDDRGAARDLYTSTYFDLKRRYAEAIGDRWLVLSAEHGLLHPDRRVEPYDTTMDDVTAWGWADDVKIDLSTTVEAAFVFEGADEVEIVVLAGRDYVAPIRPFLDAKPWPVRYPFDETSGIGEQMGWLSDRIEETPATRRWDEPV